MLSCVCIMIHRKKLMHIVLLVTYILAVGGVVVAFLRLSKEVSSVGGEIRMFDLTTDSAENRDKVKLKTSISLSTKTVTRTSKPLTTSRNDIPLCPKPGEKLVGHLAVDFSIPDIEDLEETLGYKSWVQKGGAWRPTKCKAVSKVVLIIPYRKRYEQLKIFLRHIHPVLKRQLLDYRILVIEQNGETPFNRAMLFNIGFNESLRYHDFRCFVFHDVDLIPEDDRNYYGCPDAPRHLSVAIDKFQYRLPYATIFGGAEAFRKEHFEEINGFSNRFWGWGGEDDDLFLRIQAKHFKLTRPRMAYGRYKMIRFYHKSAPGDPDRHDKLLNSEQRMKIDGLNSLKYKVVNSIEYPLYTLITVDVDPKSV